MAHLSSSMVTRLGPDTRQEGAAVERVGEGAGEKVEGAGEGVGEGVLAPREKGETAEPTESGREEAEPSRWGRCRSRGAGAGVHVQEGRSRGAGGGVQVHRGAGAANVQTVPPPAASGAAASPTPSV